jgi:hypothetical protein
VRGSGIRAATQGDSGCWSIERLWYAGPGLTSGLLIRGGHQRQVGGWADTADTATPGFSRTGARSGFTASGTRNTAAPERPPASCGPAPAQRVDGGGYLVWSP